MMLKTSIVISGVFMLISSQLFSQKKEQSKADSKAPKQIKGYKLVWNDEFNENGKPNSEFWSFENGFKRNNELQWYQEENAICKDGILTITAQREQVKNPNYDYTSKDWRKTRAFGNYTSSAYITSDAITVEPVKTYSLKFTGRIHKTAGASGTLKTSEDAVLNLSVLKWDGAKTSNAKFPVLTITSATNETVSGEFKIPATGATAVKLLLGKNKDVAYADDVVLEEVKK
jgi:hypothetical protein